MRSNVINLGKFSFYILIVALIILNVKKWGGVKNTQHMVNITQTIFARNGILGWNILNEETNKQSIVLTLEKDGIPIVDTVTLSPGQSVGNVRIYNSVKKGTQSCQLVYEVLSEEDSERSSIIRYDIILIVE